MVHLTPLPQYVSAAPHFGSVKGAAIIPTVVVEWDQADGLFWVLRLCERFGDAAGQWEYPPATPWTRGRDGALTYDDAPASTDPVKAGRCCGRVTSDGDAVRFEITLHNDGPQPLEDAWCWVCLIHLWAGSFQANCELPAGAADAPWRPCACLEAPMQRWLKWCPIESRREVGERIAKPHANMWQSHLQAVDRAVRAWRIVPKPPTRQIIELRSDDAAILGWSHWPCTDMGLSFGAIEPGARATVRGTVMFSSEPYTPI